MTRKCHVRFVGRERAVKSLATRFSLLEAKETIEPEVLQQISDVLKIPAEAIQNFDAEQAIHNINNTFNDSSIQNQINPLEKIIELYEVKIVALYERLIQTEKDKNDLLKKLLNDK